MVTFLRVSICQNEVRSFFREAFRDAQPDAAASPGYDHRFAGETFHDAHIVC
jgi:hypothetical protein